MRVSLLGLKGRERVSMFTVPFDDFGGLDLADAANETAGSIDLLNVEVDRPGVVRSRDGYSKLTASAGATRYDTVFAVASAVAVSSSVKFPGTGADDASGGTVAWTNPGNITASDGSGATVTVGSPFSVSHYLKATNFGFAIPGGATIVGIGVDILRKANLAASITESTVSLVKAGAVSGSNRATNTSWPNVYQTQTYGSSSDLWGNTLTPADVNGATFGAAVAVVAFSAAIANVDSVKITVYYTPAANIAVAGASGSRLDVIATDGTVAATVATATDTQSSYAAFGSPATSATYIANSGTTIRKLVGTTFSTPANQPKCKFVALQSPANRLVAANINVIPTGAGSTASTSLVHFSDAGAPETWSANNYQYLTPGDNEDIQGMVAWGTHLFVFKSTKFFDFYGTSTDSTGQPVFNYRTISGAGLAAPLAVATSPAGVYFLDRRGIYFTSGGPPQHVSAAVDRIFRGPAPATFTGGIVNPSAIGQASMAWLNDRLYIGLPLGSATTNDHTLVFDPVTGQWTLWDIPMGAMSATASQPARLLFTYAQGTFDIGQYAPNAYTDDAGIAITSRYRSPFIPLDWRGRNLRSGIHGVDKTVRESLIEGTGTVSYVLTNQWATTIPTPVALTLGTSPAVAMQRDRRAVRGRMFSFQLSGTAPWEVQTVSWNVYGYQDPGEQSEAA